MRWKWEEEDKEEDGTDEIGRWRIFFKCGWMSQRVGGTRIATTIKLIVYMITLVLLVGNFCI